MPGVARVFTGADIAGKMNGLPCGWLITSTDGQPMKEPPHPVLAQDRVRYVGDQVAMVVADTLQQARDAAEAVQVDYDVLPAVVDVRDAAATPCTTAPTTTATSAIGRPVMQPAKAAHAVLTSSTTG
jgi:carbon-monoxide dehydrogenase large subunit